MAGPDIMSVSDVIKTYPEEWVLMDIAEADRRLNMLMMTGKVLCHDSNRKRVSITATYEMKAQSSQASHLFLFQAVPLATTGQEARQALRAAREKGPEGVWRRW